MFALVIFIVVSRVLKSDLAGLPGADSLLPCLNGAVISCGVLIQINGKQQFCVIGKDRSSASPSLFQVIIDNGGVIVRTKKHDGVVGAQSTTKNSA